MIGGDGGLGEELNNRLIEGRNGMTEWGTHGRIWKNWISRRVRRKLYERVMIPSVLYESETWVLGVQKKGKVECLKYTRHEK